MLFKVFHGMAIVVFLNGCQSQPWIEVKEDRSSVTFSLGSPDDVAEFSKRSYEKLRGRVMNISSTGRNSWLFGRSSFLGGVAFLSFLSEDDYKRYQSDFIKEGKCPAGFLNGNAMMMMLHPATEEDAELLQDMEIEEGQKIQIEGFPLDFKEAQSDGYPVSYSPSNIKHFLVDEIYIENKRVL